MGSTRGTVPGPVRPNKDPPNKTKQNNPCTIPLRIVTPSIHQLSHTDGICLSGQLAADSWLFALRSDLCNRLCQSQPLPPNQLYWGGGGGGAADYAHPSNRPSSPNRLYWEMAFVTAYGRPSDRLVLAPSLPVRATSCSGNRLCLSEQPAASLIALREVSFLSMRQLDAGYICCVTREWVREGCQSQPCPF